MKVSMKLMTAATLLGVISSLAPFPTWAAEAAAEETSAFAFGGSLTGTSDYIFRGISQTRGDPAVQGSLEASYALHDLFKPYVGAWASNIDFPFDPGPDKANVEIDFSGGVRGSFEFADGYALTYDANAIYYYYPESAIQLPNTADGSLYNYGDKWNYIEYGFVPGISTPLGSLQVGLRYSPDFSVSSGDSYYLYGAATIPVPIGAIVPLPVSMALNARFGRQWILDNYDFGTPDFNEWMLGAGLTFDPLGVTIGVAWTGTDIHKGQTFLNQDSPDANPLNDAPIFECFGIADNNICDDQLSVYLTKVF
jgi:uncharacterized protein (TIGR02001 family)